MPAEEADEYIGKIEHEENVPICHAVIGRLSPDSLEPDARTVFDEFSRWSESRTQRTRNEQINARQRRKETRLALNLTRLHQQGRISDQILMLYGISGELPERNAYQALSPEEKERLWAERMERRFGPNWRGIVRDRNITEPWFVSRRIESMSSVNWRREGF